MNLQAGLKRAEMNQLATLLRMWVGGIEDASQMTDQRKLLKIFGLLMIYWLQ